MKAETYLAMRQAYHQRRAEELALSRANITSAERNEMTAAVASIPGEILWPVTLLRREFAGYRKLVERIRAEQASGRGVTASDRSRLSQATRLVVSKLAASSDPDAEAASTFVQQLIAAPGGQGLQFVGVQ